MFDRIAHLDVLGIFILLADLVEHIIKNIANHFNLGFLL